MYNRYVYYNGIEHSNCRHQLQLHDRCSIRLTEGREWRTFFTDLGGRCLNVQSNVTNSYIHKYPYNSYDSLSEYDLTVTRRNVLPVTGPHCDGGSLSYALALVSAPAPIYLFCK